VLSNFIIPFQAIRTDIRYHQPTYEYIDKDANKILNTEPDTPVRREVETMYNDIKPRWLKVNQRISQRHDQINDILPLSRKFHDALQNVDGVVNRAETQLHSLDGVSLSSDKAKQELPNIKGVLLVLDRRMRDVKRMNTLSDELAEKLITADGESEDLRTLQKDALERYEKVKRELEKQKDAIENDNIGKFLKALKEKSEEIQKVDEKIPDKPLSDDPEDLKKQLNELKVSIVSSVTEVLRDTLIERREL